ncbi:MAG: cytochrome-c peroxidase [Flavobacteriales bacterium]|jgi:cytochrome c peroxidase|nr:cytochrome-c peroxidase [Flavobacteriales bacterium]
MKKYRFILLIFPLLIACNCEEDPKADEFKTTPYALDISSSLPKYNKNLLSLNRETVTLGKKLFYDKKLSGDNTMSCNDCHKQEFAFGTNLKVEKGIDGIAGKRNSMPLFNFVWNNKDLFWDGRAKNLETQVTMPVEDPIEMHETWENAITELKADAEYPILFKKAFNIEQSEISKKYAAKALSQFLFTLISGDSKYDKFIRGEVDFTDDEIAGLNLFRIEGPENGLPGGGDCFHCHVEPLFTDYVFRNNGLDPESQWTDLGKYKVSKDPDDKAVFRTPTLRNIALTAPYMHDGRFQTLEEVIEHYNSGGHGSSTTSVLMEHQENGLQLTAEKKKQLIAFLHTLTDEKFITNPEYKP